MLLVYSAFWLFFEFCVKDWSFLVYCFLPVGIFIILSYKRVKIAESANKNSDVDRPQKAPFNEERR